MNGVIFGGRSSEHEVSIRSAKHFEEHYDHVCFFYIHKDGGRSFGYSVEEARSSQKVGENVYIKELKKMKTVMICVHGKEGEDGTLQEWLQTRGIDYLGCGAESSKRCFNKHVTKSHLRSIPTILTVPGWHLTNKEGTSSLYDIQYPVVVKPCSEGSSIGITKVNNSEELLPALRDAFNYDTEVLVETFIDAIEVEVAVVELNGEVCVSSPGKVLYTTDFYDYETKYEEDTTTNLVPAPLPDAMKRKIQDQAETIFKALGCKDFARLDFFIDKEYGSLYFNEVNTIPGMTSKSMFPALLEALPNTSCNKFKFF